MGLYNFQPRFVPFILDGRKTHTIRAVRANPDKPGNTLHLYSGLRTKRAKLLARVKCTDIENIWISGTGAVVSINGICLNPDEKEQLACRDGFSSFDEMVRFWTTPKDRLPFEGQIIHWKKT